MALSAFGIDVSTLEATDWIQVRKASHTPLLLELLEKLDEGEAHAIALSVELDADLLIIDEKKGRQIAESLGLQYTGLGGVLLRAKSIGLIENVGGILKQIQKEAGFFISPAAQKIILEAAGEANS